MTAVSDASPTRKPRWYVPTPAKVLCAVLVMQGVLFLSAHYRWFWFNEIRGVTAVFTVAATVVALVLLVVFVLVHWLFRARAQFGLSTLLLMAPVVAIPFGWLKREMDLARQQRDVVEWNERVLTRYSSPIRPPFRFSVLKNLPFDGMVGDALRGLLGDFFRNITTVSVSNELVLERVRVLTELESIDFEPNVEVDLAHLRGLNRLQTIDTTNCKIVGTLEPLCALPALTGIRLVGTQVSDEDLAPIGRVKQLKGLALGRTLVTDAGLEHLKGLAQLEFLDLSGTLITDAGLEHLAGLSQLTLLELKGTQVTAEGAKKLQSALPRCLIVY